MTGINATTLRDTALLTQVAMTRSEQRLNEADARLGDGDTGSMLVRLADAVSKVDAAEAGDLGAAFALYARAAAGATGSSLGTLVATALLAMSRTTKGRQELDWQELSPLLEGALDAMMRRGGAALGDKTILDAIHAVALATRGAGDAAAVRAAANAATARALADFRDKPNRIGRARMFAERSVGQDDPGMLACHLLVADGHMDA